ncbi:Fe-S cluster protein [Candidatus Dependentiae bacterium]|nr:Fe-S cluster protein [Candidatus Dependentiae bacterium]
MNNNIYQEKLMDHYKNPRNKKNIENPDFSTGRQNPSCGDSVLIEGKLENGKITDLGFSGSGCVISQAAASILLTSCTGKTVEEVLALDKDYILKLLGIPLGPNRIKCALLSLDALKSSLEKIKNN